MEHINEATLSLDAQRALRLIRALRALPETSGTVGAEKRAINSLRLNDVAMNRPRASARRRGGQPWLILRKKTLMV